MLCLREQVKMNDQINSIIAGQKKFLDSLRRDLHQHPETGWTEYYTTWRIASELEVLGFTLAVGRDVLVSEARMGVPEPEELAEAEERARSLGVPQEFVVKMSGGHTGLVACYDSGVEGPHLAFRFDIDALPIKEAVIDSHLPAKEGFSSKWDGRMHACAHDGHTTIGVGLARFISEVKNDLKGKITLIFQPAEEGSRGAVSMVEKGWLDDVDYFLSGHIGITSMEVGAIAAGTDGFLATSKINVVFRGKSAHSGVAPQDGNNALLAAASAAVHLHGISRHSGGATRINVGRIEAGSGRNIISDLGKLELETRGETTELNEYMAQEAKRVIEAAAAMHNVESKIEVVGQGIGAESDEWFVDEVERAVEGSARISRVIPRLSLGGSEDATYMMKRVQENGGKATYMLFGTPLPAGHHHPEFDFDEGVLAAGVETYARMLMRYLEK